MYKQITSEHIPTRKIRKREGKLPWIVRSKKNKTNDTIYSDSTKTTKNQEHGNCIKIPEIMLKKLLRKAEIQYWREQFAEADNSKKFWQVVRKAQGKDKKRAIPPYTEMMETF